MEVGIVFECQKPELMVECTRQRELQFAKFTKEATEFKERHGLKALSGFVGHAGERFIDGGIIERDGMVPDGWRVDTSSGFRVYPKRSIIIGRETYEQMRLLKLDKYTYPGFPTIMFSEDHSIYPHVHKVGDKWFMVLSRPPMREDPALDAIDMDIWKPVRISSYYQAIEFMEDQKDRIDS